MERASRLGVAWVVAASLVPSVALASGGGGMDPVTSLLYQVGNFILLVVVLFLIARKPVKAYFVGRRDQIKTDLEEAADLLGSAESRQAEIQTKLADLEAQLDEIRATSKQRAEEEGQRILEKAREAAERIQSDAVEAADQELLRAKRELREEAAGLAVELAAEILEEQVSEADRLRLLDEFITRVEPRSDNQSPNA